MNQSDDVLWPAAIDGDAGAFAEVFLRHGDRVLTHCTRRLGSRADAEDATSQVFMQAWLTAHKVRFVEGSVLPWLLVVANNVTAKMVRARAREWRKQLRAQSQSRPLISDVPDAADTALTNLAQQRDAQRLAVCLAELTPRLHDVVMLCDLAELTHVQAASALGVPVGTVKSRLSRAHAKLRHRLSFPDDPAPEKDRDTLNTARVAKREVPS